MANISWTLTVQVDGRAESISSVTQTTEAVLSVQVAIEPGVIDQVVELAPGTAASIQLLVITSSLYGSTLKFRASDGSNHSEFVTLNAPQSYTNGSVGLFGVAPNQLLFTNSSGDEDDIANIEILLARDATPA